MAIFRNIEMSFWTDTKVVDDFTPEDKYFYLYLLTNPHTNLAGCYEVSFKQISDETGYNKDTIERLLIRFSEVHNVIKYCKSTKEVYLINWCKHNWTKSSKLDKPLLEQINSIKCKEFRDDLLGIYSTRDTVSIPYLYPMDTTCMDTTVSVSISNTNNININNKDKYIDIINYLNTNTNSNYKYNTPKTIRLIDCRLNEGFTVDDFKQVIDTMSDEWLGDEKMKVYLRPETLFGTKFESYLNRKPSKPTSKVTATPLQDRLVASQRTNDEDLTVDISDLVQEW